MEDGVGGAEAKPSTSTDCYLCYSCSWFCGLRVRVGKQNRGSVLGFVYLLGVLVNKIGEVFLVLFT